MRVGQNPAKFQQTVPQPKEVTIAVISYIPVLGGYYSESLDVLKVCLNSIWENTKVPYDLMVFDNGSCSEVKDYLRSAQDADKIQYLVLSDKNYGKAGAWNFIFSAAPGRYIAYADSDIYHYPGWLEAQIRVLEKYPQAGMVTGMPMWTPEEFSTATIQWAENNNDVILERNRSLPWEDYWKHSQSLGADESAARAHYETTENLLITHEEERLYIGAAHFQFVAPKKVLQSLLPIPSNRPMGQVRLLDIALNDRGYLRFCTSDWWVRHLGNTIEDRFQNNVIKPVKNRKSRIGFWKKAFTRRVISWIYHRSFDILFRD